MSLVALLVILSAFGVLSSASAAGEDPAIVGAWTAPFDVGLIAIHSVLLPGGKVLLFEKPGAAGSGSRAAVFDPVTGFVSGPPPSATLQNADVPDPLDLFCATQSVTPDGRVVVVGGHKYGADIETGTPETTIFDPAASAWSNGPLLQEPRWYATTTEIGDGRILVFSGLSTPGVFVTSVDSFDPVTNTLTKLPASADMKLALYPRMFVLPNGNLIKVGPEPSTKLFDPVAATWSTLTTMSGSSRSGEMALLLPGLRKILVAGGGSPGVATAQILDTSAATPTWRATDSMSFARRWGNGVMLADGTVLAVGGGADSSYTGPVFASELFDPVTETWATMASQTASRMYHSTAILLPDGRVLSAGQTNGAMQQTAEIYSPPYLFHGPRPSISAVPSEVGYGQSFSISTPDAADVSRVALVRPGSATHSMHFDQRYVDLSYSKGTGTLTATAPANGNEAPPGWYMVFILNSAGVPSVASWVHVAGPGGPPTNTPPTVNAGADQQVVLPASAPLSGSVNDDGLPNPPGATTQVWSKVSGPGTVTFGDASALSTNATFSTAGTYVLRLTADDTALSASDDLTVTATTGSGTTTLEARVAVGSDDAEEKVTTGATPVASSDLELTTDGTVQQIVGMRFSGLAIPPGAVITKAYVQFEVDEVSTAAASLTVQGQAADNPPTFKNLVRNISSRARTQASVGWIPPPWPTKQVHGIDQRTPDLSSVVQEIVSRPAWTSGNALVIIVTGTGRRTAEARNGTFAPILHIEYQLA
jgi:Galactose oxidase-like, Early set domain/K319L-like, PKD domain/Galactose oxidase, central domain